MSIAADSGSGISYMVHPSVQKNAEDGLGATGSIRMLEFERISTIDHGYVFRIEEGGHHFRVNVSQDRIAPFCGCQRDSVPCRVWDTHLHLILFADC